MDVTLVRELAAELGVSPQTLDPLRRVPYAQACQGLQALKDAAHAAYKKLAFKYHPDRNRGNEAWAEARFKALPMALQAIDSLRVRPPQQARPMPVMRTVRWTYYPAASATSTSTVTFRSSSTSSGFGTTSVPNRPAYDARKVVFIRVN